MSGRVTMRDVANALGLSPMTVSRALRDDTTVKEDTRKAVKEAAVRLGYVYDTTAQAFRSQKSGFVAITLPSINNANFAQTHKGLTAALVPTELQLLLGSTNYRLEEEERLVRQLMERRPEALILTGGQHSETTRSLLANTTVPVIEIWDSPADPLGHVVGFSNEQAMRPLVEHLAERGRKRIAFLGADEGTDQRGMARQRGVLSAAADLGLPPVQVISAGPAPVAMTAGAETAEANADVLRQVDALMCVSDPVAFGALCACQRMGISVPGDLAITGFGAFEIATISVPRITTMQVFAEQIGSRTGQLIARLVKHGNGKPTVSATPTKLRLGETT